MISSSLETLVTKRQFMESNQLWFGQKCTRTQSEYLVLETPFYFTVNGILLPGKVETFFPAFLFSVDPQSHNPLIVELRMGYNWSYADYLAFDIWKQFQILWIIWYSNACVVWGFYLNAIRTWTLFFSIFNLNPLIYKLFHNLVCHFLLVRY